MHHVRGKLKLFWTLSRRHLQNVAWLEGSHSQLAKFIGPMAGFHRHFHRPAVADPERLSRGWRNPWRAREARAYNGDLGAEPPAGSRGRAPGEGKGGEAP